MQRLESATLQVVVGGCGSVLTDAVLRDACALDGHLGLVGVDNLARGGVDEEGNNLQFGDILDDRLVTGVVGVGQVELIVHSQGLVGFGFLDGNLRTTKNLGGQHDDVVEGQSVDITFGSLGEGVHVEGFALRTAGIVVALAPCGISQAVGSEDVLYGEVAVSNGVGEGDLALDVDRLFVVAECRGQGDVGLSELLVAGAQVVDNAKFLVIAGAIVSVEANGTVHPGCGESRNV